MPNARLKMVADAGHFVQWERPEVVNELIGAFLG
jgi:pimeloyl-ACP methyl ester carboxylesterase